jgi:hypothetical protein
LTETPSADYRQRTRWNVRDSDGTLVLAWGKPSGGTLLTVRACASAGKPCLVVDLPDADGLAGALETARAWIAQNLAGGTLNVAGPRGSRDADVYERAQAFLQVLLSTGGGS